jgi:hypothetical protein
MNRELELELRKNYELETRMRRIALRGMDGPKPQFRITKEHGAVVREKGKEGIDWWRYEQVILKPMLVSDIVGFPTQCCYSVLLLSNAIWRGYW